METLLLSEVGVEAAARSAAAVMRAGGVILYPTDTLYGLGADALSDEAVVKVYAIKERDEWKPIHCIILDLEMAERYAEVNESARKLAKKFLPGPLTLVLRKRTEFSTGIFRGNETVGIRIPNDEFCLALARVLGKPYTTTSANLSGKETGRDVQTITGQLGSMAASLDLIVDAGRLPLRKPSTVVDLTGKEPSIIREGAISAREIMRILGL